MGAARGAIGFGFGGETWCVGIGVRVGCCGCGETVEDFALTDAGGFEFGRHVGGYGGRSGSGLFILW